ncbi:MAG: hypothetical protein ABIF17_00005, partial [Patescibacteria group bacterium]
ELIYPPEQIFIVNHDFDDENVAINVICNIPKDSVYALRPVPYVTAENYVRCLSQSCYLLSERILEKKLIPLDMNIETFRRAAIDFELYYRSLHMIFHKRATRGETFKMRFILKNWREIKRIDDFILFTFTNKRTVISGEMSFVFKSN